VSTSAAGIEQSAIDRATKEIGDYERTVQALCAFVMVAIRDRGGFAKGSSYSLGRRMHTSAGNRVAPSQTVTPDAVVQRSTVLGYVVEAKATLPPNEAYWEDSATQLHKYDDRLAGWWSEDGYVQSTDVICLCGAPFAARFADYVERDQSQRGWSFQCNCCFVEFSQTSRWSECVYLKRERGKVADPRVGQAIREGAEVGIEDLVATFNGAAFYDGDPPVEYVMQILWQHVFTHRKPAEERDEQLGYWPIAVTAGELTEYLQRMYGSPGQAPNEVRFPRKTWVTLALDGFAQIGLATHDGGDSYTIGFRQLKGELVARFARRRLQPPPKKKPEAEQLRLLES
jgi:hypothetical protein